MRFYPKNIDSVDEVGFENQVKFLMPHQLRVFWSEIVLDIDHQAHIFGIKSHQRNSVNF